MFIPCSALKMSTLSQVTASGYTLLDCVLSSQLHGRVTMHIEHKTCCVSLQAIVSDEPSYTTNTRECGSLCIYRGGPLVHIHNMIILTGRRLW